jgi:hypothetical protein
MHAAHVSMARVLKFKATAFLHPPPDDIRSAVTTRRPHFQVSLQVSLSIRIPADSPHELEQFFIAMEKFH